MDVVEELVQLVDLGEG
jgi:hypothetical protein